MRRVEVEYPKDAWEKALVRKELERLKRALPGDDEDVRMTLALLDAPLVGEGAAPPPPAPSSRRARR